MLIGTRKGIVSRPAGGAASWWEVAGKTCIAAYQPKGAVSYAASKVNLSNPGTYDATEGVAPAWDAAIGWTFNGSTQYLKSGASPGDGYDGSWSLLVRTITTASTANKSPVGVQNKTWGQVWGVRTSYLDGSWCHYFNNGGFASSRYSGDRVSGFSQADCYLDGLPQGSIVQGPADNYVAVLGIGVMIGTNGVPGVHWFPGSIPAIAIYSDPLSAAEVATVSAAMAAL